MDLAALARAWLACFEAQDADALVALYAVDARHYSPKLRLQRPGSGGCIEGRPALREWWADAFRRLPTLRYVETRITAQPAGARTTPADGRVFLEYSRHVAGEPELPVAEVFEVRAGLIVESRVYHG